MTLSDEQINDIVREAARGSATRRDGTTSQRIARAIEAAVLAELAKQEPVAWCNSSDIEESRLKKQSFNGWVTKYSDLDTALYAAPVVQPDMVMVPREPTEAMIDSGWAVEELVTPLRMWRAMIAAAEKEQSNAG